MSPDLIGKGDTLRLWLSSRAPRLRCCTGTQRADNSVRTRHEAKPLQGSITLKLEGGVPLDEPLSTASTKCPTPATASADLFTVRPVPSTAPGAAEAQSRDTSGRLAW
ncbi:hypothetical protein NDU88_006215 [Pleurodeles waltl]|uniref:Uncharacterized protein n=1 Tax=Pleurodeles waltl TaxID=8319 RepID=A0AAV7LNG2_PLEWA|nr:hypothetical protein NDU88_006215 [Pleurodeles waltl]